MAAKIANWLGTRSHSSHLSGALIKALDPNLDTKLLVDTSKVEGCGYILIQRMQEGAVHIIRCGSMTAKRGWAGM